MASESITNSGIPLVKCLGLSAALAIPVFLLCRQGLLFWFKPKFAVHRTFGLAFLLQYSVAWYVFVTNYDLYNLLPFPYTMSITLIVQVTSAIYYFRFLPKLSAGTADPGMYSDKGVLPYDWVKENLFFAMMIVWGNIHYHDLGFSTVRKLGVFGVAIEALWCIFPFEIVRPCFPKTHFSNAFIYRSKTTTEENRAFYDVMTWMVKIFYMLSKHTEGLFISYARFCDAIPMDQMYWVRWWMLMNIGIHNIGTFVHTLRFKKMMNPRLAFLIYIGYWAVSNYAIFRLLPLYYAQSFIFLLTLIGVAVNFCRNKVVRCGYQVLVFALLLHKRYS